MKIYPILLKPCPWQVVKWLSTLQLRPPDAKPLASFTSVKREEVLVSIALEIASLVGRFPEAAEREGNHPGPRSAFQRTRKGGAALRPRIST
jgi:hypothetical protein